MDWIEENSHLAMEVEMRYGLTMFLIPTILSLCLGHVLLGVHR
jgi:hypothetical protein